MATKKVLRYCSSTEPIGLFPDNYPSCPRKNGTIIVPWCTFEFEDTPNLEEIVRQDNSQPEILKVDPKNRFFGLEYCSDAIFCGKYGIPKLKPYIDAIPKHYVTFSEITATGDPNSCVTNFDHDYVLDRLWYQPNKYVEKLSHYYCFAEPDYSLKINHPLSVQIANTYRSHVIAYFMQEHGIPILPSMGWSSTVSYEFCFDGHSKGGAVLVSTIGTLRDERSRMYFRLGFLEMLKRIAPDAVILYGDINDELLSWLPNQLDIHLVNHKRHNRARNYGK